MNLRSALGDLQSGCWKWPLVSLNDLWIRYYELRKKLLSFEAIFRGDINRGLGQCILMPKDSQNMKQVQKKDPLQDAANQIWPEGKGHGWIPFYMCSAKFKVVVCRPINSATQRDSKNLKGIINSILTHIQKQREDPISKGLLSASFF